MKIDKADIIRLSYGNGEELPDCLETMIGNQEDVVFNTAGVPVHYYRFFFRLFKTIKPSLAVELGTNSGISAAMMAEGNPDGKIITVDHHEDIRQESRRPNIEYKICDSLSKVRLSQKIDVLFIDTEHDGVRPLKEFELYKNDMAEDGIVFFDDINLEDCMKEFWKNFEPEGWVKFEIPAHGDAGFGCLMRINGDEK